MVNFTDDLNTDILFSAADTSDEIQESFQEEYATAFLDEL